MYDTRHTEKAIPKGNGAFSFVNLVAFAAPIPSNHDQNRISLEKTNRSKLIDDKAWDYIVYC